MGFPMPDVSPCGGIGGFLAFNQASPYFQPSADALSESRTNEHEDSRAIEADGIIK